MAFAGAGIFLCMTRETGRACFAGRGLVPMIGVSWAPGNTFWNAEGKKLLTAMHWCMQNVEYNEPEIMKQLIAFTGSCLTVFTTGERSLQNPSHKSPLPALKFFFYFFGTL